MEAKDTAITSYEDSVIAYISADFMELYEKTVLKPICEAQADISFKAGIEEVVGWIEDNNHEPISAGTISQAWLEKKKEWGIC